VVQSKPLTLKNQAVSVLFRASCSFTLTEIFDLPEVRWLSLHDQMKKQTPTDMPKYTPNTFFLPYHGGWTVTGNLQCCLFVPYKKPV